MAKSTPAAWSSRAVERVTLRLRSSNDPAQPTQYRYSAVTPGSPSTFTGKSTSRVQAARSCWLIP